MLIINTIIIPNLSKIVSGEVEHILEPFQFWHNFYIDSVTKLRLARQ